VSIEGRNKTAARAGGHIVTHHDGTHWEHRWHTFSSSRGQQPPGGAYSQTDRCCVCNGCLSNAATAVCAAGNGRISLPNWPTCFLSGPCRRFEWVETEFSMQPNRSRILLFDNLGRLVIMQASGVGCCGLLWAVAVCQPMAGGRASLTNLSQQPGC
jgi:hypothetical protein